VHLEKNYDRSSLLLYLDLLPMEMEDKIHVQQLSLDFDNEKTKLYDCCLDVVIAFIVLNKPAKI
jgi:hypothetical protein